MNITIKELVNLFFDLSFFNIYILEEDVTFNFDGFHYPDELEEVHISSIDDPMSYEYGTPFTINVSRESFDDYNKFKEVYKDYMI